MGTKQITRDQHYVQRKYLAPWTDDLTTEGFVNAEIDNNSAKPINIKRILFEKDYYEIPVLNNDEIGICYACLSRIPLLNKKTVMSYIRNLIITKDLNNACTSEQRKDLKRVLIQLGEDFQKCAENMMDDELRSKIFKCDSSFLEDEIIKHRFLTYLFMQYFRTPAARKGIANNINDYIKSEGLIDVDGDKIWAAIHGAISSGAANFMVTKKVNIKFLKTDSELLLTSDCPVVRLDLAKDNTDRFYYPFSPTVGMIIGTNDDDSGITKLSKVEINQFNGLMRNNSKRFVISKCNHR